MNTRVLAVLLAVALPVLPVRAQDRNDGLAGRIDALVRGVKLRDAKVGVMITSVRDRSVIYEKNAEERFRLASNTKLLTTAAALCLLDDGFTFRTIVGTKGGDLHLFAGGDPNISGRFHEGDPTAIFRQWSARLKKAGVTRVGKIVLHAGIFDDEQKHPGWKGYDRWWWWTAPFGAFSLNDNCVDLTIEPGPPGGPCKVTLSPDTEYVSIANRTKSVKKSSKAFGFTRRKGSNVITLRGEVAGRATYPVAIHDPTRYFGTVLKETLVREGVAVTGGIETSPLLRSECPDVREIASWESGLPETLGVCNRRSQNYYAEMLLRVVGWRKKGKGTTSNGIAAVREFLTKEIGCRQASQLDGSGLSRDNFASPADLVALLQYMRSHRHARIFRHSLAVNGASEGTLRRRMRAEDVKGRVRAKTGHIRGVSTLSGYAEGLGGDTYVFSILVNGSGYVGTADPLQDRICELLVRHKGE